MLLVPDLGLRLRRLRFEGDMTQKQLADLTGITQSYLSRLERGHIDPPLSVIIKLANAFQITSLDEFLFGSSSS